MPPLFYVDESICTRDGLCAAECPLGIISMKDGVPSPVKRADELCLRCGHCVAICPSGAFSHRDMAAQECSPIERPRLWGPEQTEQFLRFRRSIRHYKDQPVEKDKLSRLMEMARYAPSGHNNQPVSWLVLYEKQQVREAGSHIVGWMRNLAQKHPKFAQAMHMDLIIASWEAGQDKVCWDAPHLIVTHAPQALATSASACMIALTYLDLAAPSLGLGTCWSGFFTFAASAWQPLKDFLALPQGHACFGAMMAGYPKYSFHRLPSRNTPPITWR